MVVKFEGKKDQILADNRTFTEPVEMRNCVNCQLVKPRFDGAKSKRGENLFEMVDNQNCKIIEPEFFNKKELGLCFNLTGAKSDGNEIINPYWHDIENTVDTNGHEPLRIGNSNLSHCWLNTKVENPRFENINTREPELISIKSCGNWIINPQVKNCTGSITIRHGHTATIQGGDFWCSKGRNSGIRVYGKANKIDGVKFHNNDSMDKSPLRIMNGDTETDPNEAKGIPLGTKNKTGHSTYTQVKGGTIINCVFDNCKYPVTWGVDAGDYKPSGVKFVDNHYIATKVESAVITFSRGATDAGNMFDGNTYEGKVKIPPTISSGFKKGEQDTPDPIIVPDPEPDEPTGGPIIEPPQQPEEDPGEQPVDEPPKYAHVCQVDGVEEGKKIVGVWLCPQDADLIKPLMQVWWKAIRESIKKGELKSAMIVGDNDTAENEPT